MVHKPAFNRPWNWDELADHYDELARLERLVQTLKHSVLIPARRKELAAEIAHLQAQGLVVLSQHFLAGIKVYRDARCG